MEEKDVKFLAAAIITAAKIINNQAVRNAQLGSEAQYEFPEVEKHFRESLEDLKKLYASI